MTFPSPDDRLQRLTHHPDPDIRGQARHHFTDPYFDDHHGRHHTPPEEDPTTTTANRLDAAQRLQDAAQRLTTLDPGTLAGAPPHMLEELTWALTVITRRAEFLTHHPTPQPATPGPLNRAITYCARKLGT